MNKVGRCKAAVIVYTASHEFRSALPKIAAFLANRKPEKSQKQYRFAIAYFYNEVLDGNRWAFAHALTYLRHKVSFWGQMSHLYQQGSKLTSALCPLLHLCDISSPTQLFQCCPEIVEGSIESTMPRHTAI